MLNYWTLIYCLIYLQNWRSKIKDQDQNMKIIGSDLDHTKDQDHLFDLDLSDQDQ